MGEKRQFLRDIQELGLGEGRAKKIDIKLQKIKNKINVHKVKPVAVKKIKKWTTWLILIGVY